MVIQKKQIPEIFYFVFFKDERSNESSNIYLPTHVSNGIRPSSSSPMVIANGNHPTIPNNIPHSMNNGNNSIRNAFSHNPLNILERYFY
jgi:hypothetical protein